MLAFFSDDAVVGLVGVVVKTVVKPIKSKTKIRRLNDLNKEKTAKTLS